MYTGAFKNAIGLVRLLKYELYNPECFNSYAYFKHYMKIGGRVLGPVIGIYRSGSNDLSLLRDLAASELVRKHLEYNNMGFFQAREMFKNKLSQSWGQHIARDCASMLLDRLRDYVIHDTPPCTACPA